MVGAMTGSSGFTPYGCSDFLSPAAGASEACTERDGGGERAEGKQRTDVTACGASSHETDSDGSNRWHNKKNVLSVCGGAVRECACMRAWLQPALGSAAACAMDRIGQRQRCKLAALCMPGCSAAISGTAASPMPLQTASTPPNGRLDTDAKCIHAIGHGGHGLLVLLQCSDGRLWRCTSPPRTSRPRSPQLLQHEPQGRSRASALRHHGRKAS